MKNEKVWSLIKNGIIEKIGEKQFNVWFQTVQLLSASEKKVIFGIDTPFKRDWVLNNYEEAISSCLTDVFEKDTKFEFQIERTLEKQDSAPAVSELIKGIRYGDEQEFYLNPDYTFSKLAVGTFNEIAYSYAKHLAENVSDNVINPLFIYGGVGLGKTHIIQALGNYVRGKYRGTKVGYTSMDGFLNDMARAIQNKAMIPFRERYESLDMLLVDDVQFIAGKPGMQERFFHIFNELYNRGKVIVLTSDKMINEIQDIEERLVSRFSSGQSVEITYTTEVDRVAILRKRMVDYKLFLSDDLVYYLAGQLTGNVRDLITALKRISMKQKIEGKQFSDDQIKSLLGSLIPQSVLNIDSIMTQTSAFFDIRLSEITSTRRTKNVLIPRQVAMYFMKKLLKLSYPSIANEFGGKDHTTVLNAVRKIDKLRITDSDFKLKLERLKNKIYSGR